MGGASEEAWKPSWNTISGRSTGGVPGTRKVLMYGTEYATWGVAVAVLCTVLCARSMHPTSFHRIITCIIVNGFARIRVRV